MVRRIGTLGEKSLHAALKSHYAQPGDLLEHSIDGYVIDIVRGLPPAPSLCIEIQTRSFTHMKRKLLALLAAYRVHVVYPIAQVRYIARLERDGSLRSRRKSPKRGAAVEIFQELVSFPVLINHPNLTLEVLLVVDEQLWIDDGAGSWRRRHWSIADRRLLHINQSLVLNTAADFAALLPAGLPDEFESRDLAACLGRPRPLAQKMIYCLREMGMLQLAGKRGNALVYRRLGSGVDAMPDPIVERILRDNAGDDLLEILAGRLTPTDLQSIMLEVYRRRAQRITPANLLTTYEQNRFCRPAATRPQTLLEFDRLAMSLAAPLFEPLALAPVCPLGANSVVAAVDQNKAVATVRNTEVVSDSTNVLALECALRRRSYLKQPELRRQRVRLCASHRLLRAQKFTEAHQLAHFLLFGLCTAGCDEGARQFEIESLAEHIAFYLHLFAALPASTYSVGAVRVALTDLTSGAFTSVIQGEVFAALAAGFPEVQIGFEPERNSGRGYYTDICFHIYVTDDAGREHSLVDGGLTNWTQQLLSNRKERLLISGVGTEHLDHVLRRSS